MCKPIRAARETIPVFFAVDERYIPCLCVAIRSLLDTTDPACDLRLHILVDHLSREDRALVSSLADRRTTVSFTCVDRKLSALGTHLHLRDYYTQATYYRFFIPDLFPEYDKGLYLDCDLLLTRDVAPLFRTDLGERLVGAVPCDIFGTEDLFGRYGEEILGVRRERVFNAGVLLMNLAAMRRERLEEQFAALLNRRRYTVTQDQDYLNVLCRDRVVYFPGTWNATPFIDREEDPPALIHFKLHYKPWHYRGVRYEELFWKCARRTPVCKKLRETLAKRTAEDAARDRAGYDRLVALAEEELAAAERPIA